jgi:molecular chaperone GrpE
MSQPKNEPYKGGKDNRSSSGDRPGTADQDDLDANDKANDPAAHLIEDFETMKARALERDQFLDLLKRTQADFENYQKRNQRERELERRYYHAPLVLDLLGVLDNLERATQAAQQASEAGPLVQGVALVLTQLLDLLKRHGVSPIAALGEPFDPNLHQAVMQEPAANVPPHTVIRVLEQGFMIYDRVLRPAKVVVSAAG